MYFKINCLLWYASLISWNSTTETKAINSQIDLAKKLLSKKINIFGSCWGLQVVATAAGGVVKKNKNGLAAVISKNIKLNNLGKFHKMYNNKPRIFDAFCWHYDETETLPQNSVVLSSNKMSNVQSICFERQKSSVWAVQYHK